MMIKRKICVVSSSRADYNHLFLLMQALKQSKKVELKLIATGMHLLKEFGNTYKQLFYGFVEPSEVLKFWETSKLMIFGNFGFFQESHENFLIMPRKA